MNNLKSRQTVIAILCISVIIFISPLVSYSEEYSHRIISTNDSPYDVSMQYQIRNSSGNLICVVESSATSYYDSPLTREYLNSHQTHKTIEKNNQTVNYVLIKDSWRVGEGDSFLSAVKHIVKDDIRGKLFSFFFATTNGCAVQPGDMVTVYWKVFYL